MDTREIVHRYYELANRGAWDEWCELFAPDHVMDEQLAGRVEGRETLREMMRGFPELYAEFANEPVHVVVAQGRAAVVSRITARTASGAAVEAAVCNFFQVEDGLITYMSNHHDSAPFAVLGEDPGAEAVGTDTGTAAETAAGTAAEAADAETAAESPLPVPRWSHVGLNCRDQAVTEAFYRDWFGFRRARVAEDEHGRVVFLRAGDVYLELFPSTAEPRVSAGDGPRHPGVARHLAFQVDDLDAFLARAHGRLPISLGPLRFDDLVPGWRTVWVTDPDGVVVEVGQGYVDQDPAELAAFD